VPRICWHSARDRIAEVACLLAQVAATLGKIAKEICNLQRTELGEVREPFFMGKVGSSTMPHKQNPSTVELVAALARLVRGALVPLTDALFQEHERDAACWRIEWAALPEAWIYTGAMLGHMRRVLAGLEVREERMSRNLGLLGGLLLSERVMLALGERMGKQTAHEIVYEIAMRAQEGGMDFRDALLADARVTAHLDRGALEQLLDPAAYTGLAAALVDAVVGA
jgi:adenylosuccinate lyase